MEEQLNAAVAAMDGLAAAVAGFAEQEHAADALVCAILNRRILPREELIALVLAYGDARATANRERYGVISHSRAAQRAQPEA